MAPKQAILIVQLSLLIISFISTTDASLTSYFADPLSLIPYFFSSPSPDPDPAPAPLHHLTPDPTPGPVKPPVHSLTPAPTSDPVEPQVHSLTPAPTSDLFEPQVHSPTPSPTPRPVKPPVHSHTPAPRPVTTPVHPPVKAPKPIAIRGVVFCKQCKNKGFNTLVGAKPLSKAVVKLKCDNRHTKKSLVALTQTGKDGHFVFKPKNMTAMAIRNCKVLLVSSMTCSVRTNLHGGISGAIVIPQGKPLGAASLYKSFNVRPLAFEPARKCD